jgi:hypothetical protein
LGEGRRKTAWVTSGRYRLNCRATRVVGSVNVLLHQKEQQEKDLADGCLEKGTCLTQLSASVLPIVFLAHSLILKIEAIYPSEALVNFHQTT